MRRLAFLLLFLVVISSATSLRLYPGSYKIEKYEPGKTYNFLFNVEGTGGEKEVRVTFKGDLAEYAVVQTGSYKLEGTLELPVSVTPPEGLSPGGHVLEVVFTEVDSSGGGLSAVVAVKGIVKFMVPIPGKYGTASIELDDEIAIGETAYVNVIFKHLGTEIIDEVDGTIDIKDVGEDSIIDTILLTTISSVDPGDEVTLRGEWDTTGRNPGRYHVLANVTYDDAKIANAKAGFVVGVKDIKFLELNAPEVEEGEIAVATAKIWSNWNEMLTTVATVKAMKGDNVLSETVSSTMSLERWEEREIKTFLDVTGLSPGVYSLVWVLDYDGGATEGESSLIITPEKAEIEEKSSAFNLSYLVIGILVAIVLIMFAMNIRKRNNPQQALNYNYYRDRR
jgi:hypothetical protein